jgi:hypothetical protein
MVQHYILLNFNELISNIYNFLLHDPRIKSYSGVSAEFSEVLSRGNSRKKDHIVINKYNYRDQLNEMNQKMYNMTFFVEVIKSAKVSLRVQKSSGPF